MATKSGTPFFTYREFLHWAKEQAKKDRKYRRLFKPRRFVPKKDTARSGWPLRDAELEMDIDDWLDSGHSAEEYYRLDD